MSALTEAKRDRILSALVDAYANNPSLSSLELRDINASIAKRERVDHMVVAGVASNFIRGAYGDYRRMINARRRELGLSRTSRIRTVATASA